MVEKDSSLIACLCSHVLCGGGFLHKTDSRRIVCSFHREPAIPGMHEFCFLHTDIVLDHTVLLVVMHIPVNLG